LVKKLINRRFGALSSELNIKIDQLSISKLEDLATELLEITEINQLENW
ncbi:MAG: DUF4351 domain-containing protein, partial [Dolichospermum sp.]